MSEENEKTTEEYKDMIKKRAITSSGLRQIIEESVQDVQGQKTLRQKVELAKEEKKEQSE